ncbi:MAG: hypothetical protein ACI8PP_000844 [Candidatus Pseudothioglobus sp.]|jgi:hypothetical protein
MISFTPITSRIERTCRVRSPRHRGGLWLPIKFGPNEQIVSLRQQHRAIDLLLFETILIIGLPNIVL